MRTDYAAAYARRQARRARCYLVGRALGQAANVLLCVGTLLTVASMALGVGTVWLAPARLAAVATVAPGVLATAAACFALAGLAGLASVTVVARRNG